MRETLNKYKKASVSLLAAVVLLALGVQTLSSRSKPDLGPPSNVTVMVTNNQKDSGGSGVIVTLLENESEILTNSHVCGVLKNGGKVTTTDDRTYTVKYYKQDVDHDLCLVVISGKLDHAAKLAAAPSKLLDPVSISGHPNLLPNIVTSGHSAENKTISIFNGFVKCVENDLKDEFTAEICMYFGGKPVITNFESTVVSALIMAGSSGSGVYNSSNEIVGLAFAGSGDLSYAFTVPFDYVKSFYEKYGNNQKRSEFSLVDNKLDLRSIFKPESLSKNQIIDKCKKKSTNPLIKDMCDTITNTLNWRK